MLKHIVLFKLKEDADRTALAAIKTKLEELPELISELVDMEVLIDNISDENYDFGLIANFANKEDLDTYATHPAHLVVVKMVKEVVSARACVDYEG